MAIKKQVRFLYLFIALLIAFISLSYVRLDNKPSAASINNAISWTESLAGEVRFPYLDGTGYYNSYMNCTNFTAVAYGMPALYGVSAGVFWYFIDIQHPGDWNAPRGSLVFFMPNEMNQYKGHMALSLGNGELIEAGYSFVEKSTIKAEDIHGKYLGWAWPPQDWPGRNDNFAAIAFTWAMQAVYAAALTATVWAVFALIRKITAKKRLKEPKKEDG